MQIDSFGKASNVLTQLGVARAGLLCVAATVSLTAMPGCSGSAQRDEPLDPVVLQDVVDRLLTQSAEAWNGGDLAGFIGWYKRGPETTFLGSTGVTHGWEAIRERYADRFGPDAERDSLRFEDLETRPLAPELGLATARYVLFREDSVTATGVFTIVVERTPDGWRIIHDQSS